ncbi:ABC transporter substrate-binding protein [Lysinimonas soli]|uniref:ABC transporter substrate-binding protein n=1 Tax=Lysinimonas soli TaxID=1074233 RepID=A0ABW0NRU9_9MICO
MHKSHRRIVAMAGTIAVAASLAACASTPSSGTSASAASATVDLAAAGCPATIVIQTDWNPESEHGHLYEMLGKDAVIDADKKSVSGTLELGGKSTGVKVEIRAGGPAIGFTGVAAQMYTDTSITMGYVTTDDQIANSAKTPTKAFFAPLDESPIMVMWDPKTYPDVKTVKDLGKALTKTGGVWRYFSGSAYIDYLTDAGYMTKAEQDSSYDGTPANFVAAAGKDVQQGFASAEPYIYEHEVPAWNKPVKYALISSTGWDPYQSSMAVRTADFTKLTPCLKALTPVLQQEEVDYFANPKAADALIQKLVAAYNTGWTYSPGVADYSRKTMIADKLVSNGTNSTLGDFDKARMDKFFTAASAIYTKLGTNIDPKLKADDLYTNEFIDSSIGLK